MKRTIALLSMAIMLFAGCSTVDMPASTNSTQQVAKPEAYSVLEDNGYTEINLTGNAFLGCSSKEDSLFNSYHFVAKNPFNKTVKGTVCCSFWGLKDCTVRFSH